MSKHGSIVEWRRAEDARFTEMQYSRAHVWRFDGGAEVAASSSPHSVPPPWAVEANVDPEEAFVAALSSCHMLWFLYYAAKAGCVVDLYRDEAEGIMEPDAEGRIAITRVTLRPEIRWSGERRPGEAEIARMHHQAHGSCYIANSVRTDVVVASPTEPRGAAGAGG